MQRFLVGSQDTPAHQAALYLEDVGPPRKGVERLGRELRPTWKAFRLLFALKHFEVDEITSPELTGDWEFKLKQMEHGKLKREEFMEHIEQVTRDLVERIKNGDIPDTAFATVPVPCPKCGGTVQENYRKFQCQKCDFAIWKVTSGREWSPEEVAELIGKRYIGPLTGFRSRMGKPFSAALSGVRSSWDTIPRNSSFARLAAWASMRSRRSVSMRFRSVRSSAKETHSRRDSSRNAEPIRIGTRVPSLRTAPLPRARMVRPLGVPAGSFSVTDGPPRVGTRTSPPRAASA